MNPRSLVPPLRAWLDGATMAAPLPTGVSEIAGRHRLNGTLYHIGARLSEPDAAKARESWAQNVANHLARAAGLKALWAHNGPPPLVFKGADLAENLYDDPGARACCDLDVLLPQPHYAAAIERLPADVRMRPPPRGERFRDEMPFAVGVEVDDVLIEIHREPQPPHRASLRAHALYERGQAGRLGDLDVLYPEPTDRLLLWLTNQAKESFYGDLASLVDLALILRNLVGPDLAKHASALRAGAADVGLGNAFDLAVLRLGESALWPGTLPSITRPTVHVVNALLPRVFAPLKHPPTARFQAIKTWLCTPAARARLVARAIATLARGERPG